MLALFRPFFYGMNKKTGIICFYIFNIIFIFFPNVYLFSQDSAKVLYPLTINLFEKNYDQGSYSPIDTSLERYQYFLPGFFSNFKTLGNNGSPGQSLIYAHPQKTGYETGINFLDAYASDKDKILYYKTRRPYSKIFFLMGSKEEQLLNIIHTQNIGSVFNFGFNYTNITSTGFYQKQKTKINDLNFHSHFESKNKFYGIFSNFVFDKMTVEENGGLLSDIYFEENLVPQKDAIPVSLQGSTNQFKKKSWYFKPYLNLGRLENVFDSKDSVSRKTVLPLFRLAHTFSFEKKIFSLKDNSPDSMQYLPLFNFQKAIGPAGLLKDSINIKNYENTISFSTIDFISPEGKQTGFKNFFSCVFLKHQNIQRLTHNDNFDTTFQNLMAGADMNFRFLKIFRAGGNALQVLDGFNKADNYFEGYIELTPNFKKKDLPSEVPKTSGYWLRIESFHQIKHPDWIYTHYYSDQLQWQKDFLNSTCSGQKISYVNEKWNITAGLSQEFVKNPMFFAYGNIYTQDTIFVANRIIPQQRKGRMTITQAYIEKKLRIWKFHLNSKIYYQETSNEVLLPFPEVITYNSFYFESRMLRKSIYGQIGVDLFYHSAYYSQGYSPYLKQFYLQNEKEVGNYPYVDFFINFKIKTVRAFFKITHVNSGFSGNNYYLVPHYPQPDRAFHFGIDWRFLD